MTTGGTAIEQKASAGSERPSALIAPWHEALSLAGETISFLDREAILQGVSLIDEPRGGAAVRSTARNTDPPGPVRAERLLAQQLRMKRHARGAAKGAASAGSDQATCRIDCHARRDAAAGCAPVDLAIAEDTEIARRMRRVGRCVVGQQHAVK